MKLSNIEKYLDDALLSLDRAFEEKPTLGEEDEYRLGEVIFSAISQIEIAKEIIAKNTKEDSVVNLSKAI